MLTVLGLPMSADLLLGPSLTPDDFLQDPTVGLVLNQTGRLLTNKRPFHSVPPVHLGVRPVFTEGVGESWATLGVLKSWYGASSGE